jgi:tetratricopeptide (TPR) repeat protein
MNDETPYESVIQKALARISQQIQKGDLSSTIGEIQVLLTIDDHLLQTGPLSAIVNLITIASSLMATQSYREIEPLFAKAINALQAHPDTLPMDYVIPLNNLLVLYENMGNRQAVNQVASFMVNVASQLTGPIDATTAKIFIQLGSSYQGSGETEAVSILYRQVNNYMTSDTGINPKTRYDWLMMYASFLQQTGDPGLALEILEQAYSLSSKVPDQDPGAEGHLLSAMGSNALAANALEKADQYLSLAIKQLEDSGMADTRQMSITCHNLASTIFAARTKGRYAEASDLVARSLAIVKANGHANDAEYAGGLGLMANIATQCGDADQAQHLYGQAFAIYETAADTNKDEFANYLTDAGFFFLGQHNLQQAARVFNNALNLRTTSSTPNSDKIAKALSNLALVYFKQNDLNAAIEYYTRATDLRHQAILST